MRRSLLRGSAMRDRGPGLRRRRSAGYSLLELLLILVIAGLSLAVATVAWQTTRGRSEIKGAARLSKIFLHRARMNSIYEGINHFFVIDTVNRRIEIYADTGTTPSEFDNADPRVAATEYTSGVGLALPAQPPALTSPLDGTAVSDAWALPDPDSSARWGTELFGVMTTPTGLIRSAEATPATIGGGLFVFSDAQSNTAAVGIRGREGSIRAFELFHDAWKEL